MSDDAYSEPDGTDEPRRDDEYPDRTTTGESLPTWWQRAIDHFEAHGLHRFQPPRFQDGTHKHTIETELEVDLDVTITFQCKNGELGDDWTVFVDDQPVGTVGRHRSREGHTVYEIGPEEFRDLIRSTVTDD